MTAWKPLALFIALAYALAWIIWLPLLIGPAGLKITHFNAFLPLFVSMGTVGPLLGSFVSVRYETGRWKMPSRFFPPKRLVPWLHLLTAPILLIVAFVVVPYIICATPGHKAISLTFLTPLARIWPNILGGPLEEEFGWRGYLLPRLTSLMGPTRATLLVGAIWSGWHLPLILCHIYEGMSFWFYLSICIAVSVFASLAYFVTGRSILGAILLHYVFNTCSFMLAKAFDGKPYYPDRDWQQVYLTSMIAVAVLTVISLKGRLGDFHFLAE
jgi:uncharacterized protein